MLDPFILSIPFFLSPSTSVYLPYPYSLFPLPFSPSIHASLSSTLASFRSYKSASAAVGVCVRMLVLREMNVHVYLRFRITQRFQSTFIDIFRAGVNAHLVAWCPTGTMADPGRMGGNHFFQNTRFYYH